MENRKAHHRPETKKNLINRLRKIEGQIKGIEGQMATIGKMTR